MGFVATEKTTVTLLQPKIKKLKTIVYKCFKTPGDIKTWALKGLKPTVVYK